MPLRDVGLVTYGSDIDRDVQKKIERLFSLIDENVRTIAEAADLSSEWLRLLQPLHQCTFVSDSQVYVVVAVRDVGAVATKKFIDSSEWQLNLRGAVFMSERDLSFKSAFGTEFARPSLVLNKTRMETAAEEICKVTTSLRNVAPMSSGDQYRRVESNLHGQVTSCYQYGGTEYPAGSRHSRSRSIRHTGGHIKTSIREAVWMLKVREGLTTSTVAARL